MPSHATLFSSRLRSPYFALVLLLLVPGAADAQLVDATWTEQVTLNADALQQTGNGSDDSAPEPQNVSVNGFTYSIQGNVSFDSPGSPNATAEIFATYQSALVFLGGSSSCQISFQFRVVEVSTPPVSVASVPVMVSASGTAGADGDASLFANALSSFHAWRGGQDIATWSAIATNSQGQASDSFDETTEIGLPPGVVANVDMSAGAGISGEGLQNNTSSSATAYVDPVFAIGDGLIPGGGGATYRDHYTVQLSTGYWALGQTPVLPTTWGKIKTLYRD